MNHSDSNANAPPEIQQSQKNDILFGNTAGVSETVVITYCEMVLKLMYSVCILTYLSIYMTLYI